MLKVKGFDQNRFGENGDRIVDHFYAYVYEQHHAMAVDLFSIDFQIFGSEPFWLTLQYGRVKDSIKMFARCISNYKKLAANPQQNGYSYSMLIGCTTMPLIMYMHGQHEMGRKLLEAAGVNFNTAYQRVQDFCSDGVGNVYIAMDEKGDGDGLFSMRKVWWFLRCCLILNGDVSEVEAIEFLQSLPADKEFLASKNLYLSLDATACAPSKSATSCHLIMLTCVILMTSPHSSGMDFRL